MHARGPSAPLPPQSGHVPENAFGAPAPYPPGAQQPGAVPGYGTTVPQPVPPSHPAPQQATGHIPPGPGGHVPPHAAQPAQPDPAQVQNAAMSMFLQALNSGMLPAGGTQQGQGAGTSISREDVQELHQSQQQLTDDIQEFRSRWDSRPETRALRQLSDQIDELKSLIMANPAPSMPGSDEIGTSSGLATEALLNNNASAPNGSDDKSAEEVEKNPPSADELHDVAIRFEAMRIVLVAPAVAKDDDEPIDLLREWHSPGPDDSALDLRHMLSQRDQYIDWLCGQVADIASKINDWMEHFAERQVSGDEADKLKQVRQLLLAEHRTHQVKLSVERGRLFREQSQLQQEMANIASAREELEARRRDCMQALEQLQEHGSADTALVGRLTRFFKRQE